MQIIRTPNNIVSSPVINSISKLSAMAGSNIPTQPEKAHSLQFTNDDLNNIVAANGIGTWRFDMHTQQIDLCPHSIQLLGFKTVFPINLYNVIRRLVTLNAFELLKSLKSSCQLHSQIDEVIKTDNNADQWLKVTGRIFYAGAGILKMMGTVTDVTALKAEEQRQKDLMAFLSHELRTPLSTMKLYIQHAYKVAATEKNMPLAEKLMKADNQTITMASMIDNFLTLSHTEATRLVIEPTMFDLTHLVDDITGNMAFIHPNRVFKIELTKPIMVEADREKLSRVINNYLSNAVKYSPKDGSITISCKKRGNRIIVKVSDEGPGIAAADQRNLFKRYSRVYNQNTIRVKGFGLGLFLSKEIIEAHDGKVWVRSQSGKGAAFGFTLFI